MSKFVMDERSLRLVLAIAVNTGWAANDVRKLEKDQTNMPPGEIETCVSAVIRAANEMAEKAKRPPLIYGPAGDPVVTTEH